MNRIQGKGNRRACEQLATGSKDIPHIHSYIKKKKARKTKNIFFINLKKV